MTAAALRALDVAQPPFCYDSSALVRECEREMERRHSVYPGLIDAGTLTRAEANRQYQRMKAAACYLEGIGTRVTIADAIAEVKRELALRERLYPDWVRSGRLREHDAYHRYARMKRVLYALLCLQPDPAPSTQTALFA